MYIGGEANHHLTMKLMLIAPAFIDWLIEFHWGAEGAKMTDPNEEMMDKSNEANWKKKGGGR